METGESHPQWEETWASSYRQKKKHLLQQIPSDPCTKGKMDIKIMAVMTTATTTMMMMTMMICIEMHRSSQNRCNGIKIPVEFGITTNSISTGNHQHYNHY